MFSSLTLTPSQLLVFAFEVCWVTLICINTAPTPNEVKNAAINVKSFDDASFIPDRDTVTCHQWTCSPVEIFQTGVFEASYNVISLLLPRSQLVILKNIHEAGGVKIKHSDSLRF